MNAILQSRYKLFCDKYKEKIHRHHPDLRGGWRCDFGPSQVISANGWIILALKGLGSPGISQITYGTYSPTTPITHQNIELVRSDLEKKLLITDPLDAVVILDEANSNIDKELDIIMRKHEMAMGLAPMNIFLSHDTHDGAYVKRIHDSLERDGFVPWLYSQNEPSGNIDRKLQKAMDGSCAVVFFLSKNFQDAGFLQQEINMGVARQRLLGTKFQIIVLMLDDHTQVPRLLESFIRHSPKDLLDARDHIVESLPVELTNLRFKA